MSTNSIETYFSYLVDLLENGFDDIVETLFSYLGEINEIHLGFSKGKYKAMVWGQEMP